MNRDQFKALYAAARRLAPLGQTVPIIDGISIQQGAVRRIGPNGRAYCALTIDRALWRVSRSLNRRGAIDYERGALRHVRGARSWASWAVLP